MQALVGQATVGREQLLAAAGLLVEYSRAEGDTLWMDDGHGGQTPVLDLVGGFGSSLLGHHHPEIRSVVQGCLEAQRPLNAQGSHRRLAAELKEALAAYLLQHTGREYRVCLLNTGTEAVEAALKHATLAYARRVQRIADGLAAGVRALHKRLQRGQERVDEAFLRACEPLLGQEPLDNLEELLAALAAFNQRALNEEPFVAALQYAFHGKTLGSLAVTWNRDARLPFLRNNPRAVFVTDPAGFLDTVRQRQVHYAELAFEPLRLRLRPLVTLSALIYEPLRGEGGVLELDDAACALLRTLRQRHPEVALIADEVQCGLGRTGRPVESQALGLPNDYLTFAKSLGGGLAKVSALAVSAELYHPEFSLLHTSTFAEDDLSCAVGRRVLEIVQRDQLARRCADIGATFLEALRALQRRHPRVLRDVRGRGCMLGVELQDFAAHPSAVLSSLADEQLLGVVCAGHLLHEHRVRVLPSFGRRHVLRIQPSAYLGPQALQRALGALQSLVELLERGDAATLLAYLAGPGPRPGAALPAAHPPRDEGADLAPAQRVGFIAHLINTDSLRAWDPTLAGFSDEQLHELRAQMHAVVEPRAVARRRVRSPLGREVELVLYGVLMDGESIDADLRFNRADVIRRHVRSAYRLAREDGCSLVGFGGYTSIVTANCTELDEEQPAVTTGNALTVAASLAALRRAARGHGIRLPAARVAIVGAAGNIGHVHATLLAQECAALTLVGRPGSRSRLHAVALDVVSRLRRLERDAAAAPNAPPAAEPGPLRAAVRRLLAAPGTPHPPDAAGTAPGDGEEERACAALLEQLMARDLLRLAESPRACADADVVVSASNSATPVLDAACLAAHKPVLACDLAMPGDVDLAAPAALPRLKLIRGGVVGLPLAPRFELPGMLLAPGEVYACAAETLLLGLAGIRTDFSKGAIRPEQVREIEALARLHGFVLDREKLMAGF